MTQPVQPYTIQAFRERIREVGERVKLVRVSAGLTQTELAEKLGTSSKTVSAIEVGRVEPSVSQLQSIAAVLEEPVGFFVGESESAVESKIEHVTKELEQIRKLMEDRKPKSIEDLLHSDSN